MKSLIGFLIFLTGIVQAAENCETLWPPSSAQTGEKLRQLCANIANETCTSLEGAEALSFLKEILPGGTRFIRHLSMINYKSFGRGEAFAPDANQLRMEWEPWYQAKHFQIKWLGKGRVQASTSFSAGHEVPLELTVFRNKKGFGVELWLDSSRRRFQSSKTLTIYFDPKGLCQGFEFSRFHVSARKFDGTPRAELRRVKQDSVTFLK